MEKNINSFLVDIKYKKMDIIDYYSNILKTKEKICKGLKEYNIVDKDRNLLDFKSNELDDLLRILDKIKNDTYDFDSVTIDSLENKLREKIEYNILEDSFVKVEEELDFLLNKVLTFSNFGCKICNHKLVKIDGNLKCLVCGADTREYELSEKEYKLLIASAKSQGLYLRKLNNGDLPLVELLRESWPHLSSKDGEKEGVTEDNVEELRKHYRFLDNLMANDIIRNINLAHHMDANKNGNVYLNDDDRKKYENLLQECKLQESELSDNSKNLFLWECSVMHYEIEMLSGVSVIELYNSAESEIEQEAVVKAYYHLYDLAYRKNSIWFKEIRDMMSGRYITANPEINQKVLDMKIRR